MNEVFIDIKKENEWIRKYFNTDLVSIDKLLWVIEDLDEEIDYLKERIHELEHPEENEYEYEYGD